MAEPIVTAFITVYNEQEWVKCAVRSLLDQSLRDIEVLVLDDGSTDHTPQILDSIDDDRLRVAHCRRSGRAPSLARAATLARGKYLANLDADDESLPNRLQEQVRFLDSHQDHGWLGSAVQRQDLQRGEHLLRTYPQTDQAVRRQAAKCIPYCHSAVTIRRELIRRGVNYDPNQEFLIDFEFFIRVAAHCKVANLPDVLVKRRVRNESFFQRNFATGLQNRRLVQLCRKAIREFGLPHHYYVFPVARLGYPLMPNSVKRALPAGNGLAEGNWSEP